MSRRAHPDFRLRACSCKGCTWYARTTCQAWDQDHDDLCGQPLCDRHAAVRGSFRFCPLHRGQMQYGTPLQSQPVQQDLFEALDEHKGREAQKTETTLTFELPGDREISGRKK